MANGLDKIDTEMEASNKEEKKTEQERQKERHSDRFVERHRDKQTGERKRDNELWILYATVSWR